MIRGAMGASRSSICVDCGIDTCPPKPKGRWEHYMVHDAVWQAAGMTPFGGYLCVGCLEHRLGRELSARDFTAAPINRPDHPWSAPRLIARLREAA
jgi:hypothetical protein